ncbi:MAG TPA: ABC transporter substrate-binding protein [Candidatus Sulfotelmatobacter sp.]|nr:ABC transporter substrate-binding protein [Candidatus Sulfotelmatobacter sp.]
MSKISHRNGRTVSRRRVIQGGGALTVGALAGGIGFPALAQGKTYKLGYVSPQTGPLAAFGEADSFVISGVRALFKSGVSIGGKAVPVEILVKDSQSNPNRAADVAADLILKDKVDLMLVASTPETTNPVSDQCEVNEVPCLSTVAPWQPWFFARGGKPDTGFKYTYHFFWGLEDVIAVYTNMWSQLQTNKVVGGLFPNDGDGNAWGDKKLGFPPVLDSKGYKLIDPGRFQDLTDNFSAQIGAYKEGHAEIITGVVIPPDWTTFWTQANQQGLKPKIASVGKALLFPVALEALGNTGQNLSTEVWWTPSHPFKSSLNGQSAKQIADAYTASTKKQWTQPIGFAHALFEIAADVMKRSKGPGERDGTLEALKATKLETIVGPIAWGHGPVKNVAKTPLVGGQWRLGGAFKYELVITSNETAPQIPAAGKMQAMS